MFDARRVGLAAIVVAICPGCNRAPAPPHLTKPQTISVSLPALPEWGVIAPTNVEVTAGNLDMVYDLTRPNAAYDSAVDRSLNKKIGDIKYRYPDGSSVALHVRWAGSNPAIVSLNDEIFYWADAVKGSDGVAKLLSILLHQ